MEMNTRLQVEHPVTEAITGLDLVEWQLRIAQGERLPLTQAQVPLRGHAIEVRLYAEDPDHEFLPATGTLEVYRESASGAGRRVDSGVAQGDQVSPFYDPMLGKLIAWGVNREQARLRLLAMLNEFVVGGVKTNLAFLHRIIAHPAFAAAELDTDFIPRHQRQLLPAPAALSAEFWRDAGTAFIQSLPAVIRHDDPHSPWSTVTGLRCGLPNEIDLHLACAGQEQVVHLRVQSTPAHAPLAVRNGTGLYLKGAGELHLITRYDPIAAADASHNPQGGLTAPMNGSIVRVLVEVGQHVEAGAQLVVLEAMKMEHSVRASKTGVITAVHCGEGEMVSEGMALVEID
jgi:3-methylcrotonyl-CoA carboxylase alpha subunit